MKTFLASAATAMFGAAMTLDWSQIMSARTAGVVMIVLGAGAAIVRALYTAPPALKPE